MNLVIDDAIEVKLATNTDEESRRELGTLSTLIRPIPINVKSGQILLKGDNVSLIQSLQG